MINVEITAEAIQAEFYDMLADKCKALANALRSMEACSLEPDVVKQSHHTREELVEVMADVAMGDWSYFPTRRDEWLSCMQRCISALEEIGAVKVGV